jgi:predicted transcriptional regulator
MGPGVVPFRNDASSLQIEDAERNQNGTGETMTQANYDEPALKQALKEALVETLQEQRDLLHEVFTEVLEDFALAEAIREGQKTKGATRDEVFNVLQGNALLAAIRRGEAAADAGRILTHEQVKQRSASWTGK